MNTEDAINSLKHDCCAGCTRSPESAYVCECEGCPYKQAVVRAVEALAHERPRGYWNYIQAGMAICPFCGASPHKQYKNFCAKCGAELS